MKPIKETTVCVVDHGLFIPIAQRLAQEVKKVYYTTVTDQAFPSVQKIFGDGFEGVELIGCPFEVKKEVDAFIFPDIGFAGLQRELYSQGFPVWGHMGGDELEVLRGKFLEELKVTDLPMPPHKTIIGISGLRDFLRRSDREWYIKISRFRGDWETFHWRSWPEDNIELSARSVRLGPWGEEIAFYLFEPINTKIEDGCDSYCIDGAWPKICLHAMEAKDRALIGTFQNVSDLPKELSVVNNEFSLLLKSYGYRGFFSTEVRITPEGESYFIDPTCRAGSPPSQIQTCLIDNYAEVLIAGANGDLVEPKPSAKFGIQAVVRIKCDKDAGRSLRIPAEIEQWVKAGMCSRINDILWFPPGTPEEVCWLTATGNSIGEAIKNLKAYAEALPDNACCDYFELSELIGKIQEAEKQGMEFTDQPVPNPEIVLDGKS